MTRNFHRFIRAHILPPSALRPHPVVLNTWEASYFNINEALLLRFAEEAAKIGIDILVMEDGWFGKRNSEHAGLGDWYEDRQKCPQRVRAFVKQVIARGIQFGI